MSSSVATLSARNCGVSSGSRTFCRSTARWSHRASWSCLIHLHSHKAGLVTTEHSVSIPQHGEEHDLLGGHVQLVPLHQLTDLHIIGGHNTLKHLLLLQCHSCLYLVKSGAKEFL